MIKVSAFPWVPPFAQGLVRDLRVRWALEEAGLPYVERLVSSADQKSVDYRKLQPFGQVPTLEEDGVELFESGAIVMHIAEKSNALMPAAGDTRAHVKTWMFAALNTIEPPIMMMNVIDMQGPGSAKGLVKLRDAVMQRIRGRLENVATFMGERKYLVADRFTAADLLMVTVLRILRTTDIVGKIPALEAYCLRGEERPAFKKALAAQMATFEANAPPKK
ncbi:MAG: glutathione S-transferase family protein [Gammaproteobacteria bacterium]